MVNPGLRNNILESIQLQSSSLLQTKHGPKVLQKLQKQHPHIFSGNTSNAGAFTPSYKSSQEFGGEVQSSVAACGAHTKYVNKKQQQQQTYQVVDSKVPEFGQLNANSQNFVMQANFHAKLGKQASPSRQHQFSRY